MRRLTRPLAITLMATIPATIVCAQELPSPDKPAFEKHRPSPETMSRLEDGRIAFAKAALKLTPEQEKLWAPFEEKIRANFAERQKWFADWAAKHAEHKDKAEPGKGEKLGLPERIEKRSERMTKMAEWMTKRAAKSKELAEVLKPLYGSFSEEQKAVASRALDPFLNKEHGRRGPRWAMHGGGFGPGRGPWSKAPGGSPEAK